LAVGLCGLVLILLRVKKGGGTSSFRRDIMSFELFADYVSGHRDEPGGLEEAYIWTR
jgi:hypothetical protein